MSQPSCIFDSASGYLFQLCLPVRLTPPLPSAQIFVCLDAEGIVSLLDDLVNLARAEILFEVSWDDCGGRRAESPLLLVLPLPFTSPPLHSPPGKGGSGNEWQTAMRCRWLGRCWWSLSRRAWRPLVQMQNLRTIYRRHGTSWSQDLFQRSCRIGHHRTRIWEERVTGDSENAIRLTSEVVSTLICEWDERSEA